MGNTLGAEIALANEIRTTCDKNGVERNPEKSAQSLQKLAEIYRAKSPDRLAIIQSVALMNIALTRQPQNESIKARLSEICSHLLKISNAKQPNISLQHVSEQVAMKIYFMRNEIAALLVKLTPVPYNLKNTQRTSLEWKRIKEIEAIQNRISFQYIEIMDHVFKKCGKIMGPLPCEFTVVGMGSLASKAANPYSDFKCIIILRNRLKTNENFSFAIEYFRWFATIFQVILLNLKETPISKIEISVLNNFSIQNANWFKDKHTFDGVGFAGIMPYATKTPFGNNNYSHDLVSIEMIKPMEEMVQKLTELQELNDGFHLADVSCQFCFVSGSKKLFCSFVKAVREKVVRGRYSLKYVTSLCENLWRIFENLQIDDQLCFFAQSRLQIRKMLFDAVSYFILTVGRLKLVESTTCFDITRELYEMKVFKGETFHLLLFAHAVSCEARLKAAMKRDVDDGGSFGFCSEETGKTNISKLVQYVGEYSLVKYFEIVCGLHEIVKKNVPDAWNIDVSSKNTSKYRIFILNLLNMFHLVRGDYQHQLDKLSSSQPSGKVALHIQMVISLYNEKRFEKAFSLLESILSNYSEELCQRHRVFDQKGKCLYRLKQYVDALTCLEKSETFRKIGDRLSKTEDFEYHKYELVVIYGLCKLHLRQYSEGLDSFVKALIYLNSFGDKYSLQKADCKANIGNCFLGLGKIEQAKRKTKQALELYRSIDAPALRICNSHHILGLCFMEEKKYKEALEQFKTDSCLRTNLSGTEEDHIHGGFSLIHLATSKMNQEQNSLH